MISDNGQPHEHKWVHDSTDTLSGSNADLYRCSNHRLHENSNPAFLCKSLRVVWPDKTEKIVEIGHAFMDDSGGHALIVAPGVPHPAKALPLNT